MFEDIDLHSLKSRCARCYQTNFAENLAKLLKVQGNYGSENVLFEMYFIPENSDWALSYVNIFAKLEQ